ncbi:phosphotransferase system, enzyme I, PtsI [Mucilaginibacter mallensis]|uniref:Phosphoenolpyruvate-protein phosphotransferase n=1 Tax=Mucilaginibacter mallensis TaxID=652787 RepID=A0A1H1WW45_MUCMA|nr:phosphoenolpyruvate--protein phosphotransferase [Mucilaginibacter mallensis]SDT00900.1 phosphotransferase system, enzyme I, PtsI [Mucilaginibacter mallensis]
MKGIGVSPGIAIGRAYVIKNSKAETTGVLLKDEANISANINQFDDAVSLAINEIGLIKQNPDLTLHEEDIAILDTQIEFISDPQLRNDVIEKIDTEKKNVSDALIEAIANMVKLFREMNDEYMQARSADIQDIGNRILKHLIRSNSVFTQAFEPGTIIIAEDIAPSDTITMNTRNVAGFATQMGSKTSHTAIIAKAKGIPAVVGCGDDLRAIKDNDIVVLDGTTGLVFINPKHQLIDEYTCKRDIYISQSDKLKQLKEVKSATTDGAEIKLLANISSADDLEAVFDNGGEGVGLLRTELLFMDRNSFPTEDEQFEFYKKVALQSKCKSIIVRTIDIGGDKQLPYFGLPAEQNPFLGYRAIRICLDRTDLFITQLKAILRASIFGDLKIMLPMISNVQEVRQAKTIIAQAKQELLQANTPFNAAIEVGIMIEIPSAAITADILAKEVDFFSIGTNDLCQYTLAVDRMNEKISYLYDPFTPGVLRLINYVIQQAHQHQIHVAMCGEMASDPLATLLLIGMGLTEFSMSATAIPAIKNIIINNDTIKARDIYNKVMAMDSSDSITQFLQENTI